MTSLNWSAMPILNGDYVKRTIIQLVSLITTVLTMGFTSMC